MTQFRSLLASCLVVLAVMGAGGSAWATLNQVSPMLLQDAVAATGDGVALPVDGYAAVSVEVTISNTATVAFEGSGRGAVWTAVACTAVSSTSGTLVTSATATGLYQCNVSGLVSFHAKVSAWTSGTVTVYARATTAPYAKKGASGGTGASTGDHFVTTADDTADVPNSTSLGGLATGFLKCTTSGAVCTLSSSNLQQAVWLPVAACNNATAGSVWDLPTSTPAVAACVTGSNIQKGVLQYADTSGGFSAQYTHALPATWTSTGGIDAKIYWTTTATTGNAKWTLSTACTLVAASATDDPTFTANSGTTAAAGTASRVQTTAITGLDLTGCTTATSVLLHLRLFRDGNDAADTIAATANVIGVELMYRKTG